MVFSDYVILFSSVGMLVFIMFVTTVLLFRLITDKSKKNTNVIIKEQLDRVEQKLDRLLKIEEERENNK